MCDLRLQLPFLEAWETWHLNKGLAPKTTLKSIPDVFTLFHPLPDSSNRTWRHVQDQNKRLISTPGYCFLTLTLLFSGSSGCVWLRGELSEECAQHPHRLLTLHVHLRRGGCAALQGPLLFLHRRVQRIWARLQVRIVAQLCAVHPERWKCSGHPLLNAQS